MSLGRGTYDPFQMYGYPDPKFGTFTFTPVSIDGMSKTPPLQDQLCYGVDLRGESLDHQFTLKYILDAYQKSGMKEKFFNNFFNTLAGTDELKKQWQQSRRWNPTSTAAERQAGYAGWKKAIERTLNWA